MPAKSNVIRFGGARTLCGTCVGKPAAAAAPDPRESRAEAARARWAALSPEERAARVARLKAGRAGAGSRP